MEQEYVTLRKQTAKGIFPVQVPPHRVLYHLENGYLPPEGVSEADTWKSAKIFFEQHQVKLEKESKGGRQTEPDSSKKETTPKEKKKHEGVSEADKTADTQPAPPTEEQPTQTEGSQGAERQ
ncbi:hypothetical protein [Leptospira alexanderi]|uniref:hypothetical protein n=1 Tax=Leptospira alexanderi TaxID=100053 RepID=UPI000990C792|nr:hypothetical protein [Leptospira alexanderi]